MPISGESDESCISPDGKLAKKVILQPAQEFNSEGTQKKIVKVTTVKSQERSELKRTYRKCSFYFMSTCSDTSVEGTIQRIQRAQIQVVCQASLGQNPPGIGQTLEEYSSFAGQITSSPSLPAEHVHSLFPPSNAGASQPPSHCQRKAVLGN